jgi:hypothetical protein
MHLSAQPVTSRVAIKTCISPADFEVNFVKLWNEQKMSAVSGNPPTMKHEEVLDDGEEFLRKAETFVRQIRAGDAQRALERGVILEGRLAPLIRMLYHAANTHS